MDFLTAPLAIVTTVIVIVILVVAAIVFAIMLRTWYRTAGADEALVITGKAKRDQTSTIKVVSGGGLFINPFTQRAAKLSLRSRSIEIKPTA